MAWPWSSGFTFLAHHETIARPALKHVLIDTHQDLSPHFVVILTGTVLLPTMR
jgi:hypothetical protein